MKDRYRLNSLRNEELLAALSLLVSRENDALSDLLAHLAELDERRLYLVLGFPSLFAYCTEALGFCKSAAGRRIAAARVCRHYPDVYARVARGELKLSVLCALGPHLARESAAELFEACQNKSFEQVEELLATRFPKPNVRELIRRYPPRHVLTPDVGSGLVESKVAPTAATPVATKVRAEFASLPNGAPNPPVPDTRLEGVPSRVMRGERGKVEPLSTDRFGVHFTADAELRQLIEQARSLARHRLEMNTLPSLMKLVFQCFVRHEEQRRFALHVKPRRKRVNKCPATGRQRAVTNSDAVKGPSDWSVIVGNRFSPQNTSAVASSPVTDAGDRRHAKTDVAKTDVAKTDIAKTDIAKTDIAKTDIAKTDIAKTDVAKTDVAKTDVAKTDVAKTDIAKGVGLTSFSPERRAPGAVSFGQLQKRGRYIPAAVRRAVYVRDRGRCSFVASDGRRCEARAFLELDHVEPWARSGRAVDENIRLRCRAHNQMHARDCFGEAQVAAKVEASRRATRICDPSPE